MEKRPQERACHCHEQRRRNSFAGHITDNDPQMIGVRHHKIVKVAADFTGRGHHRIQFKIVAVGKRRERLRHQLHLDPLGNPQFAFDPFFGGCSHFQHRNVRLQFIPHHDKRFCQPGHFVIAGNLRQWGVQTTSGQNLRRFGQFAQRTGNRTGNQQNHRNQQQKADDGDRRLNAAEFGNFSHQFGFGKEDADRPAVGGNRLIQQPAMLAGKHRAVGNETALALHHVPANRAQNRFTVFIEQAEHAFVKNQRPVGMTDQGAVTGNQKGKSVLAERQRM